MNIRNITHSPIRTAIFILVILLSFYLLSCKESVNTEKSSVTKTMQPDLSVPPPGSNASIEKWEGFTKEKKQESWQKYFDSLGDEKTTQTDSSGIETNTTDIPAKSSSRGMPVSVVAAPLSRAPIELYYYGLAEVEASETYRITPAQNGVAEKLYVREGDFVKEGDLIFALESSEWLRTIERANEKWEAEIALAQVRLDETRNNLQNSENFYSRDLITRQELDKARQNFTEAELSYEKVSISKKTELETLQQNYASRLGVSTGNGYISRISFTQGETVNSTDFVEIVNIESIIVSASVPENIIGRIKSGAKVIAKQASAPKFGLTGEVLSRSILPDESHSYQVKAELENKNERLYPGMLMEVQIQVVQLQPNFVVPRNSLIKEGNNYFLYFADGETAVRKAVETGAGRAGLVQVSGNLKEGSLLIIEGQSYLKPGTPLSTTVKEGYLPNKVEF